MQADVPTRRIMMHAALAVYRRAAGAMIAFALLLVTSVMSQAGNTSASEAAPSATPVPLQTRSRTRLNPATPQPKPIKTPVATASSIRTYPSPSGVFTATQPYFYYGLIEMTSAEGRKGEVFYPKWIGFVGWTPDSRYAIMNYYDQYGNYWAYAFDTTLWKTVPIAPTMRDLRQCTPTMEGACREGAESITPDGRGIVLMDGTVVLVADLAK
jgi:hypothetical protein